MNKHKSLLLSLFAVIVLLLAGIVFHRHGFTLASIYRDARARDYRAFLAKPPFISFTVQTSQYESDENGNKRVSKKDTLARRKDGSVVSLHQEFSYISPQNKPTEIKNRKIIFADGHGADVGDHIQSFSIYQLSEKELFAIKNPEKMEKSCLDEHLSRTGMINPEYEMVHGFATYKIYEGNPHYSATSWIAPQLGCISLKYVVKGGISIDVESIQIGEPDPIYFDIPSFYQEVSPVMFKEREENYHKALMEQFIKRYRK